MAKPIPPDYCVMCDASSEYHCTRPKSPDCPFRQPKGEAGNLAMVGVLGALCEVKVTGQGEITLTTCTATPLVINLSRLIREEIAAALTRGAKFV